MVKHFLQLVFLMALLQFGKNQSSLVYTYAFSRSNRCYYFNHVFDVFMSQIATVTLRTNCNWLWIQNNFQNAFGGSTGKSWTTFTSTQNFQYGIGQSFVDQNCSNRCCCDSFGWYHCNCQWQLNFSLTLDFALVPEDHQYNCVSTTCTSCRSGYIPYNNYCRTSINYCKAFLSITDINRINMDYYDLNNQCKTCAQTISNCYTCSALAVCTSCVNTLYALDFMNECQTCSSFIINCSTCSNNSTCLSCNGVNILKDNLCRLCSQIVTNCNTCSSSGICLTCLTGYGLDTSSSAETCALCSFEVTNCAECTTLGHCSKCIDTHYVMSNPDPDTFVDIYSCELCTILQDCLKCIVSTACLGCVQGFAVNTSNLCQPCSILISDCQMCTDRFTCTRCVAGFALNSTFKCRNCDFFMPQCVKCSNNLICTECNPGFLTNIGNCVTCNSYMANCMLCTDKVTCTKCSSGFALNQTDKCQLCSVFIPNCLTCSDNNTCTSCGPGFYVYLGACKTCPQILQNCNACSSNTSCSACNSGTILELGRCLSCQVYINHCNQCSDRNTCTLCIDPYVIDSRNKCNKCKYPLHYVSDLCSQDRFCISAYKNSNQKVTCSFCDFIKNYVIDSNNKCVCQKGFKNVNQVCEQICGDGIIFKSECDDNNTVDGDGCSASCRIETDFICYKLRSGMSKCKLDKNIDLKLEYVDKVMNENKALIYINLDTNNRNVRRFYQSALFNFTLQSNRSQTIKILKFEKNAKGQIVVEVQFSQTIEDSAIHLKFEFPKDFVTSENQQLNFIFKGNNFALIISGMNDEYGQIKQIEVYFIASSYVIVLAFLFSEKFIAVEALVSFQMVFFSLLMIYDNSGWSQGLSTILPLKYSMGFNQLLYEQTNFVNLQDPTFNKYRYLKMCEPFLMNNFTNSSILVVLSFIFLLMFYIKTRKESQILTEENSKLKKKAKKQLRKFVKIFKKVYNLTFHFSYIMIFQVIISLYIESAYMKSISPELKILSKFAAIWTFSVIIFTILDQFKHLFLRNEDANVQNFRVGIVESRYKAVYLCYIMLNAIIICLLNDKLIYDIPPSAILGFFSVIYMIFIFVYTPYRYSFGIHGFTIIVNQLIYMLTLALITTINLGIKFDEIFLLMFCYTLLAFCALIIFLTFVRVFLDYKYGVERVLQEIRKEIAERQKSQEQTFVKHPLAITKIQNYVLDGKNKRNKYIHENNVKQYNQINYLNELKAKTFLSQQERDFIYYKFYNQKPLNWVQKHEKKAKYQYLLQRKKEDIEKDIEKKELDRKKEEKAANKAELDELRILKEKMRAQYEEKKLEKEKKKKEMKTRKRQEKERQENQYQNL